MKAIDLFAGAGGWTQGAVTAGARVLWAANHKPLAVETHAANHPDVTHACQDLRQYDFTQVPRHDLLLASPCCQGHSNARGTDKPQHDDSRSTAWAVIACVEAKLPRFVVVENVPEFTRWKAYAAWKAALEAYGYQVTDQVLNTADFGMAQERRRLFVVASRGSALALRSPGLEPAGARTIIDWNAAGWTPNTAKRSPCFWAQVEDGRRRRLGAFLVSYNGRNYRARELDRPLGTVTTRDRWAIVDGRHSRFLNVDELRRAMGFPAGYQLPAQSRDAKELLGNAVPPPLAAAVVRQILKAGRK